MIHLKRVLIAMFLTVANLSIVFAQSETIERIRNTGQVSVGYSPADFPFSYDGPDGKPIGYTLDLCHRIIDGMRNELGNRPTKFRIVPINLGNRVAMIANGTIDMECDLSTDLPGREEQIAFLDHIFIGNTKIVVLEGSKIATIGDLSGKRLLVIGGTSNVQIAMDLNTSRHLNMKIVPVKTGVQAFKMLETGEADGFLHIDIRLSALIALGPQPTIFKILDEPLAERTFSIMVRREDSEFRKAANAALRAMIKSGELEAIYKRWFQSPIEPGSANLNVPISAEMRESFSLNRE